MVSQLNYADASLDDWRNEFRSVYRVHDERRSVVDLWTMSAEYASRIGEGIRIGDYGQTFDSLAHTFRWTIAFADRLIEGSEDDPPQFRLAPLGLASISQVIWYKYPNICPRCLLGSCDCPMRPAAPSEPDRAVALEKERGGAPYSRMRDWQRMFDRIYSLAHVQQTETDIAFHLLEEVGEVFRAIRRLRYVRAQDPALRALQSNLADETADVLSWMFSLSSKVTTHARMIEDFLGKPLFTEDVLRLDALIWKTYGRTGIDVRCPYCGGRPCDDICVPP